MASTVSVPLWLFLIMALLERGVRAITGGHWYVSAAHTDELVDETLNVFEDALATI